MIKDGSQKLIQVIRWNPLDGIFPSDELFLHHFAGNTHSSQARTLTIARLQHVDFLLLDGELKVLNIAEVLLQHFADPHQLLMRTGHDLLEVGHRIGSTNTRYNVLTLGIHHELTPENIFTRSWVTGKGHTGT